MTEAEWLAATDPTPILAFLKTIGSERKLRLFAVACSHRIWPRLTEGGRYAVQVAELFADGRVDRKRLKHASQISNEVRDPVPSYGGENACGSYVAGRSAWAAAEGAARTSRVVFSSDWDHAARLADQTGDRIDRDAVGLVAKREMNIARTAQISLIADIFGNPFRPVAVDPTWLTSTAVAIATGIYDDKAFDCLPILADALQDAGCENADILNHCRGDGQHVRGCWALDLILGKT